jgi:serine/threonine-protein kinase RsbW
VPGPGQDLLEESAEDLFEHAPCGYLSSAPDGTVLKVNQTFLRWTGYAREELVGVRRLPDLLAPGDRIYFETHLAPLLRMQGSVREIAVEIVRAGGDRLPALVNADLRLDAAGRPAVIRTTVFDATDRRSYERELLQARERERAARERVERLQRLTAALAEPSDAHAVAQVLLDEVAGGPEVDAARLVLGTPGEPGTPAWRPSGQEPPAAASARALEVPLRADGRALGVLTVWLGSADEPTGEQRAFFEACAAQAAQAIERSELQALARAAARRAAFLARAGGVMDDARGLDERARRLLELVVGEVAEGALLELRSPRAEAMLIEAADPRTRAELQDLGERRPSDPRDAAVARAMQGGEPQLVALGRPGSSLLALGLRGHGGPLGALVLARGDDARWPEDMGFLTELADRVALSLESALLYEQEHEVAATLQQSLLPEPPPSDPRGALAALYRPAVETLEVGGDWHDAFAVAHDRLALVVGDVVGRGLEAATTMGRLQSAARALLLAGMGPAEALMRLDAFAASVPAAELATMVVATVGLDDGETRVACAGHPPPAVFGTGGPPELVWAGRGAPLACAAPGDDRGDTQLVLPPGAGLLLYTDGLVERRDRSYDEGFAALLAELPADPHMSLPAVVERVTARLLGPAGADDDVCVLAFARAEPGPPA